MKTKYKDLKVGQTVFLNGSKVYRDRHYDAGTDILITNFRQSYAKDFKHWIVGIVTAPDHTVLDFHVRYSEVYK